MKCIACQHDHENAFCPECGERAGIERITLASIAHSIVTSVSDMDRGLLFNIKTLFLNPAKITSEYIQGKRKRILNPVSFLVLAITLYILVLDFFTVPKDTADAVTTTNIKPELEKLAFSIGRFLRLNIKYFWILSIVPLATSLKLLFGKYNFPELLATSSFVIGQATLVGIVSYLIFKFPLIFDPFVYGCIFWLIFKIFKAKKAVYDSLIYAFFALMLFLLQLIILVISIAFLISGSG